MVDALFFGNPAKPGWIEMYVNGKGRECVNALFPEARIAWKPLNEPGYGYDPAKLEPAFKTWDTFEINLPGVAGETENKLAPVNGDQPLGENTQAQLAFVLAISVKYQGGRAARVQPDGGLGIIGPEGH